MGLRVLSDFVCLAETRSFVEAARLRNVTASGLSRQLRSLEQWVGADLVDRSRIPAALTDAGRQVIAMATRMVGFMREAETWGKLNVVPALVPPAAISRNLSMGREPANERSDRGVEESLPKIALKPFHRQTRHPLAAEYCTALNHSLTAQLEEAPLH